MASAAPASAGSWDSLKLSPAVLEIVKTKLGFSTMTPVQAHTISPFLSYKDVAVEVRLISNASSTTLGADWLRKDARIRDPYVRDVDAKEGPVAGQRDWGHHHQPHTVRHNAFTLSHPTQRACNTD